MSIGVAEFAGADCDSGKASHSSTEKLRIAEFGKNEELVQIAKNRAAMDVWLG